MTEHIGRYADFAEASKRAGRAGRWASGWSLLMRSDPLFGFGLGRFGGAVAMQNQTVENMQYFYMDNYYLKILVEQGFVGLFGYVILILTFLYNGMKCVFKALNGKMGLYVVGMFSGMCGVLAHCFFENIFEVPYMMAYFWGMAAIIMWVGYINKDGSK